MKNIGIIGFGNMGGALGVGLKGIGKYKVRICEAKTERAAWAKENHGIENISDKGELFKVSDIIVIAVKPQELESLFKDLGGAGRNKQIISICAGKKISYFQEKAGTEMVCRFMPNLAAIESKSVVGVSFPEQASEEFRKDCLEIAGALGFPTQLPEILMPAITGLSGSGIAFVFAFIHAMALGGTAAGISYTQSLEVTLKTIEGAVAVLENQKVNPIDMLSKVISPAGTTIKGVEALEKGSFTYTVMQAIQTASNRAVEMEG